MLSGSMTALITPFKESGAIDWSALKKIVEQQIVSGTDVLVPCGTTGESPTLSHEEHDKVIEKVIEYSSDRAKVMAGTGSNSTQEAIRLTRHAKSAGANAALIVAPYYNKPTQEGLYKHYMKIAESVDIPIIVYNIPGRTGIKIDAATIGRLAKSHKNIAGVKEATGSLIHVSQTIEEVERQSKRKDFSVLSGDDMLSLPLLSVGGHGVISVLSNLFPKVMKDLVSSALEGDFIKSQKLHKKYFSLMNAMFLETNPSPIKEAMYIAGHIKTSYVRPPLEGLNKRSLATLKKVLAKHGIK